jgi:hypothetical protein
MGDSDAPTHTPRPAVPVKIIEVPLRRVLSAFLTQELIRPPGRNFTYPEGSVHRVTSRVWGGEIAGYRLYARLCSKAYNEAYYKPYTEVGSDGSKYIYFHHQHTHTHTHHPKNGDTSSKRPNEG